MPRTTRASPAVAVLMAVAVAATATLLASVSPGGTAGPVRQDLPEGPGKTVVVRLCAGCHDLMFTLTTRETEEGWTRIINDMRSRGTDGTEAEFEEAIAYLSAHMGKPERTASHASVELVASRTRVDLGERFAVGLRVVPAAGWHLKGDSAAETPPTVSWTIPQAMTMGAPVPRTALATGHLVVFPAMVSRTAAPGSTLHLIARLTYEVCRGTCVIETATASLVLPIGSGGAPSHEEDFALAGGGSLR